MTCRLPQYCLCSQSGDFVTQNNVSKRVISYGFYILNLRDPAEMQLTFAGCLTLAFVVTLSLRPAFQNILLLQHPPPFRMRVIDYIDPE